MYRYRAPDRYVERYPRVVRRRQRLTPREKRWRLAWPYLTTLILANLMLILTLIIFGLEISSLAIDSSSTLSNTASTGAGIWCSISFLVAVLFMYLLVLVYNSSQLWSTITLVIHLIALVFICVLISLDANTITPYNTQPSSAPTKIQLLRGQLAGAILMLLFPISFLAIYIYTAFVSILPPPIHASLVHLPVPYPTRFTKY